MLREGETQRLGIEWQVLDREATIAEIPEGKTRARVVAKLEKAELEHTQTATYIDHRAVEDALRNMNTKARTIC